MNAKAVVGLVRSRMAYAREWPEVANRYESARTDSEWRERVFDVSALLVDENAEVDVEMATCGRNLPFPLLAIVGSGHGVFVVVGDEGGLYSYCYSSPVQMLVVHFTATGWAYEGVLRPAGEDPEFLSGSDVRVQRYAEALSLVLTLVQRACDDTRRVVSYTLTRAERRAAAHEAHADMHVLDNTFVHRVCLDAREKHRWTAERGVSVVPTPKRLHEVRAHWRHLASGKVVRVKAHCRGKHGAVPLPRIYTATKPLSPTPASQ